jgi:hypothetical protein
VLRYYNSVFLKAVRFITKLQAGKPKAPDCNAAILTL